MIVITVKEGLGETRAALKGICGFARTPRAAQRAGRPQRGARRARARRTGLCAPSALWGDRCYPQLVWEWRGLALRLGVLDMNGC